MPEYNPTLLGRWSDWDSCPGQRTFARAELDGLWVGLGKQSIALVKGCRGVGKSTLLRMLAGRLLEAGFQRESIAYIDLEDPLWAPAPNLEQVVGLIDLADPVRVVLLDGVERLPGWTDWARSVRSTHKLQVAAAETGPTGAVPQAGIELVDCLPLDLRTWIEIFTDKKVDPFEARASLPEFLKAGGLPVARKPEGRRQALIELFFASLMKDVVLQFPIRDVNALTSMSVNLISNSGLATSASRFKGFMTRSVDQARMYLAHLQASGLVQLVSRIEDASRSASQASRLCFAADTGLSAALRESGDLDLEQLCFTAVFHQLQRQRRSIWAWRVLGRTGLAVGPATQPDLLLDVQTGLDARAGLDPLARAMQRYSCGAGLVLTTDPGAVFGPAMAGSGSIETLPLWNWLLDSKSTSLSVESADGVLNRTTDTKVGNKQGGLPPHLL